MKVSLLFVLLAIYGAVADSDEVSSTESDSTQTQSDSSESGIIGALLEKKDEMINSALAAGENTYGKIVDVVDTSITAGTEIASQALNKGTELGAQAVTVGNDIAQTAVSKGKEISNSVMDLAGSIPIFGKHIPTQHMKEAVNTGFDLGSKGVSMGTGMAQAGIAVTNNLGQLAIGGVDKAGKTVTSSLLAGGKMGSAMASNMAAMSSNVASGGIKAVGGIFSKFGSGLSSAANMKTRN